MVCCDDTTTNNEQQQQQQVMKSCFQFDPDKRPDFSQICRMLDAANRRKSAPSPFSDRANNNNNHYTRTSSATTAGASSVIIMQYGTSPTPSGKQQVSERASDRTCVKKVSQ